MRLGRRDLLIEEGGFLMSLRLREVILSFCGVLFFVTASHSAERSFYQGKTINFVINFAAGGPTDIEGRIIARHLAKHIPGQPTFVPQNMAGAGGVTGINFLGEVAKPDGLTIGYFTGPYSHQMMQTPPLRGDLIKIPFVSFVYGLAVWLYRAP